jgi:hypothetical protein
MGLEGTHHFHVQPKDATHAAPYRLQPWYDAYMAALFESDRRRIGEKIRTAERLILIRERALMGERNDLSEHRALNNALHALRALQACMKSTS